MKIFLLNGRKSEEYEILRELKQTRVNSSRSLRDDEKIKSTFSSRLFSLITSTSTGKSVMEVKSLLFNFPLENSNLKWNPPTFPHTSSLLGSSLENGKVALSEWEMGEAGNKIQ